MEKWGGITVDPETGETSIPRVYAAGDIVTGETLVIKAMAACRRVAQRIHEQLVNSTERLDLSKRYFDERYGRKPAPSAKPSESKV